MKSTKSMKRWRVSFKVKKFFYVVFDINFHWRAISSKSLWFCEILHIVKFCAADRHVPATSRHCDSNWMWRPGSIYILSKNHNSESRFTEAVGLGAGEAMEKRYNNNSECEGLRRREKNGNHGNYVSFGISQCFRHWLCYDVVIVGRDCVAGDGMGVREVHNGKDEDVESSGGKSWTTRRKWKKFCFKNRDRTFTASWRHNKLHRSQWLRIGNEVKTIIVTIRT